MKTRFTDFDSHLFHEGLHDRLYEKMGAHLSEENGVKGVHFVLWAPHAKAVCVVSDDNGWTPWRDNMLLSDYGMWELFIPCMKTGTRYKYRVLGADGVEREKTDPYGFAFEKRPGSAAVVTDISGFTWTDDAYMNGKDTEQPASERPMAIYEVHLGSWKKDEHAADEDRFMNYRDLAHELAEYVNYMGYTHVELMGICEYPLDMSWGYQVTGYFAPTSRYGSPGDFLYFVNHLHRHGIGVILDWVPAHFPKDAHCLGKFDGTPLYESADPLRAEYPEWGTFAFDHGKKEVANFLTASALYFVNVFHIDALRVDAVAAMLYLNFSREKWRPNIDGGMINYESAAFLRHVNKTLRDTTHAFLIAEDSSIEAGMTKDVDDGGYGFGFKWDMGWMNESIRYLNLDPVYRKYHHHLMTHPLDYIFEENYLLPLSHDEVVYGKGSMFRKIPGNHLEKLGCLKSFYTMMFGIPGKKLLFMGNDFAQDKEWDYTAALDWFHADDAGHREVMDTVRFLLHLYRERAVLHNDAGKSVIFEWIDSGDVNRSIFSFIRRNPWNYDDALYFVCAFTPVSYKYAMGVPARGKYRRIFSTYLDGEEPPVYKTEKRVCNGREYRVPFELRPFEAVIFEKLPDTRRTGTKSEAKTKEQ